MSAPSPRHSGARFARASAAVLALALVSGCAKVPVVGGKAQISVRLTAVAKANSCGQDAGNSMAFRVVQVTDASGVTGASLAQFWDREDKVLGPAFLSKHDGVIDPGQRGDFKFERDDKAKAFILVGSFCKPQGNCWYVTRQLSKGSSLRLVVDEFCFRDPK